MTDPIYICGTNITIIYENKDDDDNSMNNTWLRYVPIV